MSLRSDEEVSPEYQDEDSALTLDALAFFGRITANVSHEFKNRLATIKEKAGLLADLTAMAEKGIRPLDLARVNTIAKDIARQVETADGACLRLNRFAHSVDVPERREDLVELVSLITRLIERQAVVAGVEITLGSCPKVEVETNPFLFQQVVYYCLLWALDHAQTRALSLDVGRSEEQAFVSIKGAAFDELVQRPSNRLVRALRKLGGRLEANTGEKEVTIRL
ncbi:MAG: HAMP domain-containing histidine kinase [Deltaproteobacteria bacterium]|nr:HAMP domain-containing histidine kinase [Deltaproteobacteria bacterium]